MNNAAPYQYTYDKIGNLVQNTTDGIADIEWNIYGKVEKVTKTSDPFGIQATVEYRYDGTGNRIMKKITAGATRTTTTYLRDASGNVMAIYEEKTDQTLAIKEIPIYGSSRLGQYRPKTDTKKTALGQRIYEFSNHLGNVLVTLTDNKVPQTDGTYSSMVVSASDYYPFGMVMGERTYSNSEYRYGFNGKENDNDFGSHIQDYGFRLYSAAEARFLSVDPLTNSYPFYTPYQFAGNKPIKYIDLDGLEETDGQDQNIPQTNDSPLENVINLFNNAIKMLEDALSNEDTTLKRTASNVKKKLSDDYETSANRAEAEIRALDIVQEGGSTTKDKVFIYTAAITYVIGEYTDVNDAAVLTEGRNLNGKSANTVDYVTAGVGLVVPFLSGAQIKALFRGTSMGYAGNTASKVLPNSSTSTNPAIATLFAIEGKNHGGNNVVYVALPDNLKGVNMHIEGNVRVDIEKEVGLAITPTEFAKRVELKITADEAKGILSEMNIHLPARVGIGSSTQMLKNGEIPDMTQEQIDLFIQKAIEIANKSKK